MFGKAIARFVLENLGSTVQPGIPKRAGFSKHDLDAIRKQSPRCDPAPRGLGGISAQQSTGSEITEQLRRDRETAHCPTVDLIRLRVAPLARKARTAPNITFATVGKSR